MPGPFLLSDIAAALGARVEGRADLAIRAPAEPAHAGPDDLALAMSERYAPGLAEGRARAAVLWDGADWRALGLEAALFVPRPRYAMAGITALMDPGPRIAPGVHPSAVIEAGARVGEGAAIGPFVHVAAGARIGAGARIAAHASIGAGAALGEGALVLEGARIGARVRAGDRLVVHPNAVIGADGFSFVTPERSNAEAARAALGADVQAAQSWTRIHSLGSVEIGDDVEVGACTTIDRGTVRDTRIGRGTKIDNLVQVGHNCVVGADCLLCGHVGLAGSVTLGDRVILGGKVGVSDNTRVGDDVVAGGGTNIFTNVPAGRAVLGSPAVPMETRIKMDTALRRLPRLMDDLRAWRNALQKDGGGA